MKRINLRYGTHTLVDDEDFDWLNQWKWRIDTRKKSGYASRNQYIGRKNGKGVRKSSYMHREILKHHNLIVKGKETDHINRDKLDNRKENLRMVTHQINQLNRSKQKNNTSGFTGIDKHYGKWRAKVKHGGQTIHLGYFDTIQLANQTYKQFHYDLRREVY